MARPRKATAASSRLVPSVLRLLRARGVDTDALARALRLPPGAEHRSELAIAPSDFEALMAAAARALGDPLLAVRLPDMLEWPSYSLGELAARASPTLRDAFEQVVRYASLFYAHLAFRCENRRGELVVTHRLRTGGRGGRYGNEYALAATLSNARKLSGARIAPRRVFFSHARVAEVEALREHFGTRDVTFGRDENGIVFAAEDAARPSLARDARLLATAEELAARALADRPPSSDFVAAVAAALRGSLADGRCDARAIARKMKLGMRTLQRRLEEHDTTYTELVERVRKGVAMDAIDDISLTLSEVAQRAGFSDAATFGRAFKRWTGRSPGAHRKSRARGE